MPERDIYDSLSPIDYRYWDDETTPYLSENGFTRYKLKVELALVKVLHRLGICSRDCVVQVDTACDLVTTKEVYEEEKRIWHDIRALVNCIRRKVSYTVRPFVHMSATSYDIVDTANAARYRDVIIEVLVPALIELQRVLVNLTLREADTPQIGRTHGQHAVPITFGFAIAEYVSRLGNSILILRDLASKLNGKFAGATGAYNASSLFFDDPEDFERKVLAEMDLQPGEHSTQIVQPEDMTRLFCEVTIVAGILANLSDDMRNLQRTEIGEVGEEFEDDQVGSSTMPQKRNPINFENSKSMWKIVMPRIITVFMDQISEHQRDLTNSASSRTYGEQIAYVVSVAKRLTKTMSKLVVDRANMERNLAMQKGLIVAEPLYIILASMGHADAHEKVRTLTLLAQKQGAPLWQIIVEDDEMQPYIEAMTRNQRNILRDPTLYSGIAAKKARSVANRWQKTLDL